MKHLQSRYSNRAAALAITDGEHVFTVLRVDGSRRVKGYPPDALLTARNFRQSNIIAYNSLTDGAGNVWSGDFQDGDTVLHTDKWGAAVWVMADNTFKLMFTVDEQDGPYGHKPKPIAVAPNGDVEIVDGIAHQPLLVTAQASNVDNGGGLAGSVDEAGGMILPYDGSAATITNQGDTAAWLRRTDTPDIITDGTVYGRGNTHSFHDGTDLRDYDPTVVPLFTTYATSGDATSHTNSIGFGHYAYGWPMVPFQYAGRWYCLARGFIIDRADDPLDPGDFQPYPCFMLWAANVDSDPLEPNSWARCIDVWAAYDVDNTYSELNGESATTVHTAFHAWVLPFGGKMYVYSNPIVPLGDVATDDTLIHDDTAVRVLDGDGWHNALSFSESNSYGGPVVTDGVHLYWVELSVSESKLYVWRLESSYDHWSLRFSTDLPVNEADEYHRGFIASAYIANGRLYVLWGRRPSVFNDATIPNGDGAERLWQMATLRFAAGTWTHLSPALPVQDFYTDDDNGTWPRYIATLDDIPETGGGGGSGPCDDVFSIHAAPTISLEVFTAQLDGSATIYGASPLLTENSDPEHWYDLITSYGVDPNYALAMWFKETKYGTVMGELGSSAKNIGNLRPHSWGHGSTTNPAQIVVTGCCGSFQKYSTWQDGVEDYLALWDLDIYAGKSISEALAIYAPAFENNLTLYVQQVCDFMAARQDESGL